MNFKLEIRLGQVELSELDGPFVKISLKGRFWHKRSTVVARVGNYLKQRIPVSQYLLSNFITIIIVSLSLCNGLHAGKFFLILFLFPCQEILEVEIEDEKQLDDSPENF